MLAFARRIGLVLAAFLAMAFVVPTAGHAHGLGAPSVARSAPAPAASGHAGVVHDHGIVPAYLAADTERAAPGHPSDRRGDPSGPCCGFAFCHAAMPEAELRASLLPAGRTVLASNPAREIEPPDPRRLERPPRANALRLG